MKRKYRIFERLEIFYLFVIALGALIITPTHIFPQPAFMYARFPYYLKKMGPFLGITWPATFKIYHYMLYLLSIVIILNGIGILFYPKFKKSAILSTAIGIFLFLLTASFFFLKFIYVNIATAITFGFYSVVLLVMELLIFKAFTKRKAA